MTIGTFAVYAMTGGLVVFKLALMALAVALLARTLFVGSRPATYRSGPLNLPSQADATR